MQDRKGCGGHKYGAIWMLMALFVVAGLAMVMLSCKSKEGNPAEKKQQKIDIDEMILETKDIELRIVALMRKASSFYSEHKDEIDTLIEDIRNHYTNFLEIENTEYIIKQWNILLTNEDETYMLINYLEDWKKKGTLDKSSISIGISNVMIVLRSISNAEYILQESQISGSPNIEALE